MGRDRFKRYEVCQLGDFVLSAEDYGTVVASGPAGSGKTSVLLSLKEYMEWAEEAGAVRRAMFMYCNMRAFPGSCSAESKAVKMLRKIVGAALVFAESLGEAVESAKAGGTPGVIGVAKGERALSSTRFFLHEQQAASDSG